MIPDSRTWDHCQYCRTCLRQIVARHFVELTGF